MTVPTETELINEIDSYNISGFKELITHFDGLSSDTVYEIFEIIQTRLDYSYFDAWDKFHDPIISTSLRICELQTAENIFKKMSKWFHNSHYNRQLIYVAEAVSMKALNLIWGKYSETIQITPQERMEFRLMDEHEYKHYNKITTILGSNMDFINKQRERIRDKAIPLVSPKPIPYITQEKSAKDRLESKILSELEKSINYNDLNPYEKGILNEAISMHCDILGHFYTNDTSLKQQIIQNMKLKRLENKMDRLEVEVFQKWLGDQYRNTSKESEIYNNKKPDHMYKNLIYMEAKVNKKNNFSVQKHIRQILDYTKVIDILLLPLLIFKDASEMKIQDHITIENHLERTIIIFHYTVDPSVLEK